MTAKTMQLRAGAFLISEANGTLSREVVLVTGGSFSAGTVLGKVTATGKYTQLDPAATDGSQQAAAVLFDGVVAIDGDKKAIVIHLMAEVDGNALVWKAGITPEQKAAAVGELATNIIIVR